MLAWYAWYESRTAIYLAAFYIFLGLGTLAKGPVAPVLAAVIIFLFVAAKRDWRAIPRTLWIPGMVLYLAVMLPWYIAVQLRNPEFFRVFILEHNFARFSEDVYHHRPAFLVLPARVLAGHDALDARAHPRHRRTRPPDLVRSAKRKRLSPARKIPGSYFFSSGCLCPSCFSAHRNLSCPAIFCPQSRPGRSWSPNISAARRSEARPGEDPAKKRSFRLCSPPLTEFSADC